MIPAFTGTPLTMSVCDTVVSRWDKKTSHMIEYQGKVNLWLHYLSSAALFAQAIPEDLAESAVLRVQVGKNLVVTPLTALMLSYLEVSSAVSPFH